MRMIPQAFSRHVLYAFAFVVFVLQLCCGTLLAQPASGSVTTASDSTFTGTNRTVAKPGDSVTVHPSEKILPQLKQNVERYPRFYLYIFGICAALLAAIRLISPSYLKELMLSIVNLKLLLNIFKEGRFDWNLNNLLLDVIFVLMLSMGIHQALFAAQPQFYFWVLAFTSVAYFIKLILIQLLANIFFGRGEALVHLLMFTMLTRIIGLILLIVLFIGLYQTKIPLPQLLLILSYIMGVSYILWLVRVYVKMKSISTGGIFYLFLYICAIELSSIIILLKEVIV